MFLLFQYPVKWHRTFWYSFLAIKTLFIPSARLPPPIPRALPRRLVEPAHSFLRHSITPKTPRNCPVLPCLWTSKTGAPWSFFLDSPSPLQNHGKGKGAFSEIPSAEVLLVEKKKGVSFFTRFSGTLRGCWCPKQTVAQELVNQPPLFRILTWHHGVIYVILNNIWAHDFWKKLPKTCTQKRGVLACPGITQKNHGWGLPAGKKRVNSRFFGLSKQNVDLFASLRKERLEGCNVKQTA